ncbi:hypothetical protein KKF05_04450 [Patescibacteria group bacterium]|nr:hypothetical protein [Patescibacteria group bacterium]
MSTNVIRHPHSYTLQLFRLALDKLPPGFDPVRRTYFERKLVEFESKPKTPYEEIRLNITQLGHESWPERQAYQEMYNRYGHSSEESFLLENLDLGIRQKFEKFLSDGGKINYLNRIRPVDQLTTPTPFERYFSPEEKFAISQALLTACDQARQEIEGLIMTSRSAEYKQLVQEFKQRAQVLEGKIKELGKMAAFSDKWSESIIDRVRVLEEGWSVIEAGVDEKELDYELEYWKGTLSSFLEA